MLSEMDTTLSAIKNSSDIDAALQRDRHKYNTYLQIPKILLLGSGDSGKTTLLKQVKIIEGRGFSDSETALFKQGIKRQVVQSLKTLVGICYERGWDVLAPSDHELINSLTEQSLGKAHARIVSKLLEVNEFKEALSIGELSKLESNSLYFLERISLFLDPTYQITHQDILNVRLVTTGITETKFNISGGVIVIDVGGQRGLRKQWAPYFDIVHSIVFVADVSCYGKPVDEESELDRMEDAINLFKSIANNKILEKCQLTLLLNKVDLLEKRLKTESFKRYYPDFQGLETPGDVLKYFEDRFKSGLARKHIHVQSTQCNDTKSMENVVHQAFRNAIARILETAGLV